MFFFSSPLSYFYITIYSLLHSHWYIKLLDHVSIIFFMIYILHILTHLHYIYSLFLSCSLSDCQSLLSSYQVGVVALVMYACRGFSVLLFPVPIILLRQPYTYKHFFSLCYHKDLISSSYPACSGGGEGRSIALEYSLHWG